MDVGSDVERTLIIVKPDGVRRGLVGEVLSRFERRGLEIERLEFTTIPRQVAALHYGHMRHKPFFEGVLDAITSGPAVVAILRGPGAVSICRMLIGPTDPAQAPPGTIRGDFGGVLPNNVVHASDSTESFDREAPLFFGDRWRAPEASRQVTCK